MGIVYKGASDFTYNLNVKATKPLDSRLVVQSKSDLSLESYKNTFTIDGVNAYYPGMVASCLEDGKLYILKSESEGFVEVGKETSVPIKSVSVNNNALTPTAAGNVNIDLSGYATKSDIASVYKYQGTCTYAALPQPEDETPPALGDVWNVTDSVNIGGKIVPAGTNWAWDGSKWDALGGDVSNYLTKPTTKGTLNQILTITDADGNYAWKDAPISTSVTVAETAVTNVGGYTVVVPTTKQDKVRTIEQDDQKTVDVYSKDIIDAVITAIKTETSDLYWNSIP